MWLAWNYNLLITLLGIALLSGCLGLVGTWAVLRRRALAGDVVAHCALPGLCLGFLLTGSRNLPVMLAGAAATGMLGLVTVSLLKRSGRVKEDAAMGLVLSGFFGAGTLLRSRVQQQIATGAKAGLEAFLFGQTAGIQRGDLYWIMGLVLICLALVIAFHKELALTSFDPEFAAVSGYPNALLDGLMMLLLAFAITLALPLVGVVLVAALLILPASTARLWTAQLYKLLLLAMALGSVSGVLGIIVSSLRVGLPAGPVVVLVGSGIFLVSLACAPQLGLIRQVLERRRFQQELEQVSLLARAAARNGILQSGSLPRMDSKPGAPLRQALAQGWLVQEGQLFRLTPLGESILTDRQLRWNLPLANSAPPAVKTVTLL